MSEELEVSASIDVMASYLAALSAGFDAHNADKDPQAVTWGRISKVGEEFGEVIAAYISHTRQNPRKAARQAPITDVVDELLDVAVTALGAVEHLTGNEKKSMRLLRGKIRRVAARLDIQQ